MVGSKTSQLLACDQAQLQDPDNDDGPASHEYEKRCSRPTWHGDSQAWSCGASVASLAARAKLFLLCSTRAVRRSPGSARSTNTTKPSASWRQMPCRKGVQGEVGATRLLSLRSLERAVSCGKPAGQVLAAGPCALPNVHTLCLFRTKCCSSPRHQTQGLCRSTQAAGRTAACGWRRQRRRWRRWCQRLRPLRRMCRLSSNAVVDGS